MFVITDKRDVLTVEFFLKSGPREQELANLEWPDLELDFSRVWYRFKHGSRTKTGKNRWVPLARGLAEKLRPWRQKHPHTRYVFGTSEDKIGKKCLL